MKCVKGKPFPLGVSKTEDRVNFAVAVPDGKKAELLLYGENGFDAFELEPVFGEVRSLSIDKMDKEILFYNYRIENEVVSDPYAKFIDGKEVWGVKKSISDHEIKCGIYQEDYDWEDDVSPAISYEDVVAYSLHVRGFTMDSHSGVVKKGTFEGVVEKIPYLKELGINQIQCMPVYEFEECKEPLNYWGYGPAQYFAPKNAYSAIGDGVKSLKDMIKAFHKEGIEVVLEMPFYDKAPKQMMTDCLRYYAMEYHVDGFVCNPYIAPMEVFFSDPYLKGVKIMRHQTYFKDTMRRFLKGDEGQILPVIYWLRHTSTEERIFNYITSHSGFTLNDLVSYNDKHNQLNGEHNRDGSNINNSWNCGTEGPTQYDEIVALRKKQMRNAFLLVMLSQGTPCILAGDEWGNTQFGNNNVYCQDNEFGWLSWERFPYNHDLFSFVKELIAFRKKYRVFHPAKEFAGKDYNNCGIPDVSYHGEDGWKASFDRESRKIGVYYHYEHSCEDIYVAYNMHWEEGEFALPKLPGKKEWYKIASTQEGILKKKEKLENQKMQILQSRSIVVFTGKDSNES